MKSHLLLFLLTFSFSLQAQNASFGLGVSAVNLENTSGLYITGNVRTQLSNIFGWQTEVGLASMDEKFTSIEEIETPIFGGIEKQTIIKEEGSKAMTLKTAVTAKFFDKGGLRGEAIVGVGFYKDQVDIFGLLSGELFLSAQIGKNLVAGIPITYNFVTWSRVDYYTAGISLRFFM
jgi:hypothetical protein